MSHEIEDLQVSVAHQEVTIDALGDELGRQGRLIAELRAEVDHLKRQLSELKPSPLGSDPTPEPPPPHY